MNTLIQIIIATLLVSAIAFIGIFTIAVTRQSLNRILLALVSLSAGGLLGGAFIHLIPEATEEFGQGILIYVLAGFSLFFIVEKVLHWRHCHKAHCTVHSFAHMNLIGDSIHNFIDGLIIAASFIASIPLGIATTLAVALHEIPQEIGDFGVLVYGGYKKSKALLLNFATAVIAVAGGITGYFISGVINQFTPILLSFAAGGFIYIAASDLIPELRKEAKISKVLTNFVVFLIGIGIMYLLA